MSVSMITNFWMQVLAYVFPTPDTPASRRRQCDVVESPPGSPVRTTSPSRGSSVDQEALERLQRIPLSSRNTGSVSPRTIRRPAPNNQDRFANPGGSSSVVSESSKWRTLFVVAQALMLLACVAYAFSLAFTGRVDFGELESFDIQSVSLFADSKGLSSSDSKSSEVMYHQHFSEPTLMEVICETSGQTALSKAFLAFLAGALLNCRTFFKIPVI